MIHYRDIFNDKTLNIFADASTSNAYTNEIVACGGYVAVIGDTEICRNAQVLRQSTNNEAELYAIYMAIQCALQNRHKVEVINIFSDSQFAIFGLREWIFNWMNNIKDDKLYNSSNKLVANQSIFMSIIYTILDNNLKVSFYHNRGHFKIVKLREFIKLFSRHNFLSDYIDQQTAIKIIYFNDIIDRYSRSLLLKQSLPNKLEMINYSARNDIDLEQYKKLLNI